MKPFGYYEGDRSEYLALYALSTIGLVTPVPRQSDQFLCDMIVHLIERIDGRGGGSIVPTGISFGIQIKSDTKPIVVSGAENLRCLYSSHLPFFIGVVDKKKQHISLFHTIGRLVSAVEAPEKELQLIPGSNEETDFDSPVLRVGLGNPVASFFLSDLELKREDRERFYSVMRLWTLTDMQNLAWKTNCIPMVMFPQDHKTNEICRVDGMEAYWAGKPVHTPRALLGSNIVLMGLKGHLQELLRSSSLSNDKTKAVDRVLARLSELDKAISKCVERFP